MTKKRSKNSSNGGADGGAVSRRKRKTNSRSTTTDSFLGLDLSLTRTGIVAIRAGKVIYHASASTSSKDVDEVRFGKIVEGVLKAVSVTKPKAVGIESAIGGMTQHGTHALNGVVRWELYKAGLAFDLIAPNSLKKFATGNGRAEKPEMVAAAKVFWPECPHHDEADAYHAAVWISTQPLE